MARLETKRVTVLLSSTVMERRGGAESQKDSRISPGARRGPIIPAKGAPIVRPGATPALHYFSKEAE
ncbi:MAG: hypothetical protein QOF19_1805, partial [Alphaproteobacteria bacterium]|nr:hypothetical protein [Alphaproteobacteria bacterium]